ncbi:serine hydrolase domain-containing protein [Spongiivirga citrea]|uniref:Serine hydrolase n=1 Tax=Spongiivirga citrea TaxID=1481457 RepID=A0A6M0CFG7_9FLAO|nr:serine hydrolase domain-containing protein [Spongiivirga citrea]NER16608.1 serine hydrolase [Spongiivirga citrea]
MRTSFFFITLLLILTSCAPKSETDQELLQKKITKIENGLKPNFQITGDSIPLYNIEERMQELGIPGVSIAVLNKGEIEWAKGYGMADKAENRKVTAKTMFLAGSISKPVAALRAHQLAENNVIDLNGDINTYLKSWQIPENEFTKNEKVTTKRILNHTAGLTVWGFPGYDLGDTIPSVVDVLDGKGNTDAVRVYKEPGESWMYSGGGYTIMQLMMTDVEQKDFPELMQVNVLDPLGMTSSTFENPLPDKYHSIAATGYRSNGDEVEGKWPIYPEMAAAGLWTTPSQLILWAKEVQHISQSGEDGLLKNKTVKEMLTPGMNDHGLGPAVKEYTFGHGGADEGFRAQLVAWKDSPIAIVIMVNSDNGSIMQEILLSFVEEYKLAGIEPNIRTIMAMSEEKRIKYTGKYSFPRLGDAQISIKEDGLEVVAEFLDEPVFVVSENDSTFFDKKDGTYLKFSLEGNTVVGLSVQGYDAKKVE